ncbi:class I SAM-dependent methyltransferase [Allonocardiopsis opalescens]|uniref:Methyltransferase family protein n=1 Tax=Allonocardiopsis opalescens TaxID=1144618 RepID=A0A2T0Q4I5_9ACTN|nr:class I SAM-dependent methyltransferase [Allonocardiopsis opalescens]PRX98673.1 methyltransferase family protein [Allonocardiopsis opalescens]
MSGTDSGDGDRARRARSFGTVAALYAEHRPDYPSAALAWALEPVRDRGPLRVLDLAAGTGKLTETLLGTAGSAVPRAGFVTAVEPDDEMRAELVRRLPGVRALRGTAEAIPLPDGGVDAVVVGQAVHWFDTERALPEIARVLAPGGVLATFNNYADDLRHPWVAEYGRLSRHDQMLSIRGDAVLLPPHPLFDGPERAEFDHLFPRTADSLTETVRTHSRHVLRDPAEAAAVTDRVHSFLREHSGGDDVPFDLPLVTITLRGVRR